MVQATARISQVLPTVKCSSCGQPVPLATLGEHVCPPLPPPHMLSLHRPPLSPALSPHRLQSLVARSDLHTSSSGKTSEAGRDPSQRLPPDNSHMATNVPLPGTSPAPFDPDHPRSPPPDPVAPARPAPLVSARRDVLSATHNPSSNPSSNATTRRHPSFERPHTSSTDRSGTSLDKPRPSLDARGPRIDPRYTSPDQNPSAPSSVPFAGWSRTPVSPPTPGTVPFPSSAPIIPLRTSTRQPPPPTLSLAPTYVHGIHREFDTKIGGEAGMAGVGRRAFAAAARAAMFAASRSPSHQPVPAMTLGVGHRINLPRYLDTNATTSGHVMRVAITPPLSPNSAQTPSPVSPFPVSPDSLENGISTNEPYPDLPSPHDAMPPVTASNDKTLPVPLSPSGVRIASSSRSPSPIPNPFERRFSGETVDQSPLPDPHVDLPFLGVLKSRLDPENESDDDSVYTTHTDSKNDESVLLSPSADSDVGLAYAEDSDDDTPVVVPLDVRKSSVSEVTDNVKFPTCATPDQRHPPRPSRQPSAMSLQSAISAHSAATSFAGPVRVRTTSAGTQGTVRSVGALERAMETLIEEGASISVLASGSVLASIGGSSSARGTGKPSRSNTVPGPASPEQKPPKLPTRSHTSPSHPHVHSERVGLTGEVARVRNRVPAKRKNRMCVGCGSKIEDGRWIQMDGGNVLCERCWKNMYLPKCRRCDLPIEKQAVSSRDGQLKGKYHKGCFNCHTCQKPFPDKEFYVFDGKPFCAYHYHEANNSLCGAPSCGQPIEGPCAVTHSGKRYHPEHLLCEFEDGCEERLEEYWEVDGQMLCEPHAAFIGGRDGGWTRGHDPAGAGSPQMKGGPGTDEGRMMKRMTRFIDLGGGGDGELDIR